MKKFAGILSCAPLALAFAAPAIAQEEVEEASYKDVLACSALSAVFSGAAEGDPEDEAFHDDMGQRLLIMAMERDGAEGELALAEFEPMVTRLVEKVESFGDDDAAAEAFLTEGAELCGAFVEENREEYDAIDLEEEEEVEG